MSNFFTPQQQSPPPKPSLSVPSWISKRPGWFWVAVIAAICFVVMVVKAVVFPSALYEEKKRQQELQKQPTTQPAATPGAVTTKDTAADSGQGIPVK